MTTSMIATAMDTLPSLIDRAAAALTGARTSAEVLEARDMARVAYDAARLAGRMAAAKKAHDDVIAAVYRAQADAAVIEARAKVRLADEYDAAQARGEVSRGGNPTVVASNGWQATSADLGLRRDEIHEARKIRDAEAASPGSIEAAASALVERGQEPTKAALRREILGPAPDAAARRDLSRLTREALEDEVIGLRAKVAELRAKAEAMAGEIEALKEDLAAYRQDDMGRALGNAQRATRAAEGRMKEYQRVAVAADRRAKMAEAEVKRLRDEIGRQVIPL